HHLASEVGAQVVRDGGNAIDAVVAADAVLCVVYPHMTSVAGDLMAIVWPAGATSPVGLIGAGRSGELASVEAVRARGHETMPARGPLTVTVPGTVEAWGSRPSAFAASDSGPCPEPPPAWPRTAPHIRPARPAAPLELGRSDQLCLSRPDPVRAATSRPGACGRRDDGPARGGKGVPNGSRRGLRAARAVHHRPGFLGCSGRAFPEP